MLEQIGPYTIQNEIGRGGMGVVYLATDPRLGRDVAIKALPDELAADASRLERFEREARTLAQLNAPNIAGIHGVEEQDGRRYLVLEYVEGETLAERLDRGPIEPEEAIELASQIARGIAAAHDAGVIHRDLKPANIKITPEGEAKVLDFGLARADDGASQSSIADAATLTSPVQHSPTTPGVILGTAAYMSPEQARGRRVDKRTDIWSFGVLLYEMLTGASPFVGETATDSIGAILHKDTDLGVLPPGTPGNVRRVLKRCLARDRNDRYHDINDARLELAETSGSVDAIGDTSSGGINPALVAAMIVFACAMTLVAARAILPADSGPTELRTPLRVALPAPEGRVIWYSELSPDGSTILIRTNLLVGNDVKWFLRRLDSAEWVPLPHNEAINSVEFSPDSTRLAFTAPVERASTAIRLLMLDLNSDLPPVEILPLPIDLAPTYQIKWYAPDRMIATGGPRSATRLIDLASETVDEPVEYTSGSFASDEVTAYLGDMRFLLNRSGYTDRGYQVDVVLLDSKSGKSEVFIENANNAQLAPDGALLFTRNDRLFRAELDLDTLELSRPAQLVAGFRTDDAWESAEFTIARNGSIGTLPGGMQGATREIGFQLEDGGFEPWSTQPRAFAESVAASPDESRLVVILGSSSGLYEIWGSELDRPRLRRLRGEPLTDFRRPMFLPDNRRILTVSQTEGNQHIEIVDFEAVEPPRRLGYEFQMPAWLEVCSIHPSGDRAIISHRVNTTRLIEISLEGEPSQRDLFSGSADYIRAEYSPDGAMLAYLSDETGRSEVYVRAIRDDGSLGPAEPVTTNGATGMMWDKPDMPDAPLTLGVSIEGSIVFYDITLIGARPRVGEPRPKAFDRTRQSIGFGMPFSGGRYLTIVAGPEETPPTHVELLLDWYDQAVAELTER